MTSEILSDPSTRAAIVIVNDIPGAWNFFRTFEPEAGKGFVFSFSKISGVGKLIVDEILDKQPFHSGSSLACLMRQLQLVSKHHDDKELRRMVSNPEPENPPQPATATNVPEAKAETETSPVGSFASREEAREAFLALPKDMPLGEQYVQLAAHWKTPMTYMEMRERFG